MRRATSLILSVFLVSVLSLSYEAKPARAEDGLLLEIEVSSTFITIGEEIDITLTLTNLGNTTVARTYQGHLFNAYYFSPSRPVWAIESTFSVPEPNELTLEPGESITGTLQWNLYQRVNEEYYPPVPRTYDLYGYCQLVHQSIWDFINNNVTVPVTVFWWHLADLNHDFKVDIYDVVVIGDAYGSSPSDLNWNPRCDIAEPYGSVNMYDVVLLCDSYGEEYTP